MRRVLRRATANGYRRTALVGLASTVLFVGTLATAQAAPEADAPFSNGTAKATAVVARVAPGVGALQLGISSGVAVSEVKNTVAQSQAESVDLGLIGSTLTAESCHGGDGVLTPEQLPQAVTVDSRGGKAHKSADELPIAGTTLGAGHKEASASPEPPSSDSTATIVGSSIPGLLTLSAGTAQATTRVVDGNAREAHAHVSVDLDLAGLLKVHALTWDAFHRTGKDPKATASFDLGTGSLLGLPIPTESLAQAEKAINSALAFTGLSITFPRVERFTTPADLIRITPLRIVLQDTPVGKAVLGPVLNLTRAQREDLFNQLAKSICDVAAALLVGDIGLDVVSGTGFLAVEIGGAEATTGDLVLDSPFGSTGGTATTAPSTPAAVVPPASGSILPVAQGPFGVIGEPAGGTRPAASVGPLTERCRSAHPLEHTACSKGALLAVGLVGLGATAGVGALDWEHQRRRRRATGATPPEATS